MEKATKKPRAKKAPPFIVPLEFTRTVLSGGKWAPRLALDIIEEIFGESVLVRLAAATHALLCYYFIVGQPPPAAAHHSMELNFYTLDDSPPLALHRFRHRPPSDFARLLRWLSLSGALLQSTSCANICSGIARSPLSAARLGAPLGWVYFLLDGIVKIASEPGLLVTKLSLCLVALSALPILLQIRAALMSLMNYQLLRVTISRHMKKSKQANDAVVGAATNAMLAKNRKKTKQSVADATADQTFAESGAAEFTYSHVRYALDLHRVLLLVRWTHFLSIVRARFGYAGHALAAAALLDGPHDKESLCSSAQRMLLWEEDVEAEYPPLPPPGPSAPLYYRRMRAPYGPGAYLGVVLPFGSASLSRAGTAPPSPELLGASSSSAAAAAAANIPSIESLMMSHSSSSGGGGAASSSSSISLNLSSSDVMNVLAAAGGGGGACAPAVNFNFGDPEEMKAAFAAALLKERHARARVEAVWAAITDSGFLRVTRGLADDPTNTVPAEYLGGHRKATPEATAAAAAAEVAEAEALSSAIVAAASKKRKLPVAVIADDDDDAAPSSSFSAAAGARGLGSALGSSSGAAASVSALSSPPPTLYAFGYDTAACALRDEWVLRYIDGVTSPCSLAWWTDKGPSAIAGSEGARAAAAVAAAVAAEMGTGAPLKKTTAAATAAAAAAAAAVKKAAPKPSHPAVARAVLDDDDDDDNDDDDVVSAAAPRAKGTPLAAPSAAPPAPLPFLELKHFPSPLRTSLLCRVAAAMIRIHARASVFNVHEVQTLSVTAEQVRREIKKALKAAINESAVAAAEAAKTARASAAAVAAANYAAAAAATAAPSAAPSMTAAASARSSGTGGDPSGASSSASSSSSSSSSSALSSTGWNRTVPSIEDVKAALVTLASCPARPVVDVTPEPEEDAAPAPPPDPIYSLHFRNVFREHARRALHCIIQVRYGCCVLLFVCVRESFVVMYCFFETLHCIILYYYTGASCRSVNFV